MYRITALMLLLTSCASIAQDQSSYAGQEDRAIKSLSQDEIDSLQRGDGMGLAKLAELNHYPGPKHVLEIAGELGLTSAQVSETQELFDEMQRNAKALGAELLSAESSLDREFGAGTVDPQRLRSALLEIGRLRAELRYIHLEAHLRQKEVLTDEQVSEYDAIRGYKHGHDHHDTHPRSN